MHNAGKDANTHTHTHQGKMSKSFVAYHPRYPWLTWLNSAFSSLLAGSKCCEGKHRKVMGLPITITTPGRSGMVLEGKVGFGLSLKGEAGFGKTTEKERYSRQGNSMAKTQSQGNGYKP